MSAGTRAKTVQGILDDVTSDEDVSGVALLTADGLLLASTLSAEQEESIGERTASLFEYTSLVCRGMDYGTWAELVIRAPEGEIAFLQVDAEVALLLTLPERSTRAVALLRARRAVAALQDLGPLYP